MKAKFFLLFLICAILISSSNVGNTQVIVPSPVSSQLPMEILAGLIGKYAAMVQQYEYLVSQGQHPESAASVRVAASIDISKIGSGEKPVLDPALMDLSKMAFWINANVFLRQPYALAVDLSGSFGDIKILNTDKGAILASYDEGVYSVVPISSLINTVVSQLPTDVRNNVPMSAQELQELTLVILAGLSSLNVEYEGLKSTPKGMAHVVKIAPIEDMVLTLWVLDRTWDLCKAEFLDIEDGILATAIIDKIELITVVPSSEFELDISSLSEITYVDMINLLSLKTLSVAFNGIPVVSDLYVSAPKIFQGQEVMVISNAFDSEDEESDLIPSLEYKAPNGEWTPLEAEYIGTAPTGNWQAIFATTLDEIPGSYDFRISYTDKSGNVTEIVHLPNAVEIIAIPPHVTQTVPSDREQNVPVSSPIAIAFSQKMDEGSVESAFSLVDASGKPVEGLYEWSDDMVTFKPSQELSYNQTYIAKVAGLAKGANGASLDANGNGTAEGSPKDDLVIRFTTEAYPTIAIDLKRPNREITKGDLFVAKVMAESMSELSSFTLEVTFDPAILKVFKVEHVSFVNWRPRPKDIGEHDIWSPIVIDNDNGKITLAANKTRDTGVSGSGMLAVIAFDAIGVGETTIGFQNVLLTNIPEKAIQPALRDAKIVVRNFGLYDFNKDGVVDILDFVEMRPDGTADVNGDNVIDVLDIVAVMGSGKDPFIWDANGDGIVDIEDFIIVRRENGAEADANGDGVVDILDIVYILGGTPLSPSIVPFANDLGVNFPNPINPESWIPFKLAKGSDVVIRIFNTKGQLVRSINLGYRNPGNYVTRSNAAYWDGMNENGEQVPSGVYFYNIKAGNFTATKKMIVLR